MNAKKTSKKKERKSLVWYLSRIFRILTVNILVIIVVASANGFTLGENIVVDGWATRNTHWLVIVIISSIFYVITMLVEGIYATKIFPNPLIIKLFLSVGSTLILHWFLLFPWYCGSSYEFVPVYLVLVIFLFDIIELSAGIVTGVRAISQEEATKILPNE